MTCQEDVCAPRNATLASVPDNATNVFLQGLANVSSAHPYRRAWVGLFSTHTQPERRPPLPEESVRVARKSLLTHACADPPLGTWFTGHIAPCSSFTPDKIA